MLSEVAISDEKAFAELVSKAKEAFKILIYKDDFEVIFLFSIIKN